jgi:hypothetical protein
MQTMHRQPGQPLSHTEGEWWRISLYEIRDGCIRPAKGAKLDWYDPWPDFGRTRAQTVGQWPAGVQPGYQSLMKLVHQLEYLPGHTRYPNCLSGKSQALILEWCQQHGLLGVLLSRWESIRLAPQRAGAGSWIQRTYSRGFGQVIRAQESKGDLVDSPANVLIHALDDLTLTDESPRKTWSRFFPGIESSKRETYAYPPPYTAEFCQLYGEPLSDFCNAAKFLVGAISHAGTKQLEIRGDLKLARKQALDAINLLRRPIDDVLDLLEDGSMKSRRVTPSLLATFAEMFAQDQAYGRSILQCTSCGSPFVSSAYQAQYCSVTCRLREQKRRLRAQMKEARALRAKGQSLRQIADGVGQPVVVVKGWLGGAPKRKSAS